MANALLDLAVQVGVMVALVWIMIALCPPNPVTRWLIGIYRRLARLLLRWTMRALRAVLVRLHRLMRDGVRRFAAWIAEVWNRGQ